MRLISKEYQKLNFELHRSEPSFGAGAFRNAPEIAEFIMSSGSRTVLDYGCGKGTLKPALKKLVPALVIREFDPAIPGKRKEPGPADAVVCTDVMEHIEPDCLEGVLARLRSLTRRILIASVATKPAEKILADGRNAHLIVQPKAWWLERFAAHFPRAETFDAPEGFVGVFRL